MMKDAVVLNPINGSDLGLRDRVELINKDTDLQVFVEAYAAKAGPVAKDAAPYEEYLMVGALLLQQYQFRSLASKHSVLMNRGLFINVYHYSRRKRSQSSIRGRSLAAILQSS